MQLQLNKHRRVVPVRCVSVDKTCARERLAYTLARVTTRPAQITRPGIIIGWARGSADYARERPLKVAGGRGEKEEREKDEREVIVTAQKVDIVSAGGRGKKKHRAIRLARRTRAWDHLVLTANEFFAARGKTAVCLYEIAKRRNYFIRPCRPCHNIIKSRLVASRYDHARSIVEYQMCSYKTPGTRRV